MAGAVSSGGVLLPVGELAREAAVGDGNLAEPLVSGIGWPGVSVSSLAWAAVTGAGSAERSGGKGWPTWRRRYSAAAAILGGGGDREAALPGGGVLPGGPVGHRVGEVLLPVQVGVFQRPVTHS